MFGRFTYLIFEIAWALPVLAVQWAFGWRALRHRWPTLVLVLTVVTVYLSIADGIAISHGIWTLHRDRIVLLYLGPVPIEEILFFLLTNAMVAQSVILVLKEGSVAFHRPFSSDDISGA